MTIIVSLARSFAQLMASKPRSVCNYCGKADAPSSCSACKRVSYCNRECQRADWKFGHKNLCQLKEEVEEEEENEDEEGEYSAEATNFEDKMDERMQNMGFTNDEVQELLCQGVKPWDDDAWDVLHALRTL
mmetsp:Transcript_4852/g.8121  ORF Transcript_4852/g.8121 Transcript_4852/m.8121 type:complete len:131 (-) Transcript_4852:445-837(-)